MMASSDFDLYRLRRANTSTSAWATEDIQRLRVLASEGMALIEIARELRRTVSAVRNKAGMHGISVQSKPARRAG